MTLRSVIGGFWLALLLISADAANAALVSYWAADGNATDSAGPNSGTLVNGVSFAPGIIGQAFHFDGSSYVSAPTTGLPTGTEDRTLDLWLRVDSYPDPPFEFAFAAGYGAFGSFGGAYLLGVTHWSYIFGPQGDLTTWSQWGSGGSAGPAIQTGTWHNLGVTTSGNFFTLYLDGIAVGSGSVAFDTPAGTNFVIGRVPGSLGDIRLLDGLVDEIRVYDTALSAPEMRALATIPEPDTGVLVVAGLLGLASRGAARRRVC